MMSNVEKYDISSDQLVEWLGRLVQIPSVNNLQADPRAGDPGEGKLARALAEWFEALGGEAILDEVLPDRRNVYGIWPGTSDRWIALDVHLDTVGVERMEGDPFSGEVRNGRVYGRGAVDTKASMAVALALLESLHHQNRRLEPNLLIVGSIDEEEYTEGAEAFKKWVQNEGIQIDEFVVGEPTMCVPVFGHTGVIRARLHVQGVSTHTSQPHLGKNAITAAAHIVQALEREDQRLQDEPSRAVLGHGTLTVSMIHGGRGMNVVPDACVISIDRRLIDGEKSELVVDRIEDIAQEACPLPVRMELLKAREAFLGRSDGTFIQSLAQWSKSEPQTVPYGTNAWVYKSLAQELAVIGPGSIDQAHGDVEWVEIAELEKIAQIYAKWWGLIT